MKNRLYWKISATLFSIRGVLGLIYILISSFMAQQYFQEVNQRLYGGIAESTVQEVKPLVDGQVDTSAIQDIMHSMMVVNPSVEVYLLDTEGRIITYVAPYKRVKLKSVDLAPIKQFIAERDNPNCILGDDPRHPGQIKAFSAAPLIEADKLVGYVYIILASEEQAAVTSMLAGSYFFKIGTGLFFASLIGALIIGLLAIWFLTQNLRRLIETVRRFKEGDYAARVPDAEDSDLSDLATNFNEMADTIVDNINQIKSVENLRRELIANVSHDLRTPLAIMQGYVETLLIKEDDLQADERRRYLHTILDSSEKLSNLIKQLFEYSKLEAQQIQPEKEPFFISELAQDVFQKYQILAKDKDIRMQLEAPQGLPMVFADLGLVERVIQNLMDNALKFTPSGGSVRIELEGYDDSVAVRIADTGPGIPENEQSFIFERYRQVSNERGKKQGVGLGLAIVRKILELHDASIQVKSKLNEGTVFSFQLPTYNESDLAMSPA